MPIRSFKIDSSPQKYLLPGALVVIIAANYFFGKWALADMASTHADMTEVAELAMRLGPDDPQTHYAAAVLYEKSFLPDDIARGLEEYARAAALSPHNYLLWLDLGNARARDGDLPGAERALRIAEGLAPNYASVQWSLGNVLLREGKTSEAFTSMQKAAVGNPEYAPASANVAWQFFGGDVARIRESIGDSPAILSAVIPLLSAQKRFDEALAFWSGLPGKKNDDQLKQVGTAMYGQLTAAKRFRDAARVYADISTDDIQKPEIGKITNGDFERDIRTQGTSAFEWTVANGDQPQIALTDGQKHGGGRSLLMIFNQNGPAGLRQISQTIAVDPGATYDLDVFYRADLQTSAALQWEFVDASDGKILASTAKLAANSDWGTLAASFSVPASTDGVIIRFAANGCAPGCVVTGKIWFDDLVLTKK